jgi:hypothetical protein
VSFSNFRRCERGSFIREAVFVGALFFCFGYEKNVTRQAAFKAATKEENRLFEFEMTGHYRLPGKTKPTKRE